MADAKLSREHALALLHKLAHDDDFRRRFEENPATALAALGVPSETVASLDSACLASNSLAEKEAIAEAYRRLSSSTDTFLSMSTPNVKV